MREILFRGKRADNGEWVEGYLLEQNTPEYHCYIVISFKAEQDNRHTDILECDIYEVIPETVGQYTGLTDKSGTKIFEGDILRDDDSEENGVVLFFEGEYCVSFDNEFTYGFADIACSCYVIGNFYDNPELLKGGELNETPH